MNLIQHHLVGFDPVPEEDAEFLITKITKILDDAEKKLEEIKKK